MDTNVERAYNDLNVLYSQIEELSGMKCFSQIGSYCPDEYYLTIFGAHILLISKVEYILKKVEKINSQSQLTKKYIKTLDLSDLEKDWLKYSIYIRHTLVHKGGYADKDFLRKIKNFKQLEMTEVPKIDKTLTLLHPVKLMKVIKLWQKALGID